LGTGRSKEVISDPQRRLYNIVKSLYNGNNVIFNHPVRTKSTVRYIDVALADRMIGFEFDGVYWHKLREEKDKIRDQELEECGWTIYHFNEQDDMEAKVKLCSKEVIVHETVGRNK
jgi:very-short-patch-repair endonuclease